MSATFEQLRAAGIEDKDIQTSQLSLQPRYVYQDRRSPKIDGYDVRNTVTASTDDLDQVGPMLDALVKAGVNNINNVAFSVSEPDIALADVRSQAIKAAKAKAQAMAEAAGVSLGALTAMSENQKLSVTVNLTYEIKN